MRLILYSTEGCHLCDEAEQLLRSLQPAYAALSWDVVDIANDDALFERYGWLIPVLRPGEVRESEASGAIAKEPGASAGTTAADQPEQTAEAFELHWPFDRAALESAIARWGRALA